MGIIKEFIAEKIKAWIKHLSVYERDVRLMFIGRRHKIRQDNWLHDRCHPWEGKTESKEYKPKE